ncbi:MAG: UDP-N-acetylmuramoyl-L-alanine--D-glutamate ligase [Alphaproteobacteria bacterium]|nr:MAG: UDP-N-acetylmuramoyl-L-alanine--D-glutamate ligase [Alphaproteobacteria bacterium]
MKLILGYSKTGESVARFLAKTGEKFVIYDDKNPVDLPEYDIVIKSPGVPLSHPLCAGKKVITDLDLFKPRAKVIALTGSSGKTTLATLIYNFLKANNIETALGGNIGIPVLDLPVLSENGIYILEMSSFQLETEPALEIDIAIFLNFMPNHLDRHETMEKYFQAKMNIFKHAKAGIVSPQVRHGERAAALAKAAAWPSMDHHGAFHAPRDDNPAAILEKVAELLNLSKTHIPSVIKNLEPLEHRLEKIAEKNNVIYINDSKSTTFFSVAYGIDNTKDLGEIHLIMGGLLKENDPSYLLPFLSHVKHLYIFGQDREKIRQLFNTGETFETLEDVMTHLKLNPKKKSVVLLSPGGTSFDLYQNYIERGKHFKAIVKNIPSHL